MKIQTWVDFRLIHLLLLWVLVLSLLPACAPFSSQKMPVILVLLESFSEQEHLCDEPMKSEDWVHLQQACQDFVRLTHVYSPSILTQASVSSLMTGLPLREHGVIHNGPQAISGTSVTVAETAIQENMRTGLFMGGLPFVNKFGVHQGFEAMTSSFDQKSPKPFQPFSKTVQQVMKWIDSEVGGDAFFATLHVPDLIYKKRITQDALDNERPADRDSAVSEIHETMNEFIQGLKERKLWDKTNFIVLGLSGPLHSISPHNPLSGQFLHVPLQIKFASKVKTDIEILKSHLISFDQIGRWLKKIIRHRQVSKALTFLESSKTDFIPQRASWAYWRGIYPWETIGVRKKQYLFSYSPNLQAYDSFFDKKEYDSLDKIESEKLQNALNTKSEIQHFFKGSCQARQKCKELDEEHNKIRQLALLTRWQEGLLEGDFVEDGELMSLSQALLNNDTILLKWLAYRFLYQKKWPQVFEIGKRMQNKSLMLLAQLNLNERFEIDKESCLAYFSEENVSSHDFYKVCSDTGLRRVVEGLKVLRNKKRPSESFWNQVHQIKSRRQSLNINLRMWFLNDLDEPFDYLPSLAELYFFLPENRSYLKLIDIDET